MSEAGHVDLHHLISVQRILPGKTNSDSKCHVCFLKKATKIEKKCKRVVLKAPKREKIAKIFPCIIKRTLPQARNINDRYFSAGNVNRFPYNPYLAETHSTLRYNINFTCKLIHKESKQL